MKLQDPSRLPTKETLSDTSVRTYAAPNPGIWMHMLPRPGEGTTVFCQRFATTLAEVEGPIIQMTVFGKVLAHARAMAVLRETCGQIEWPITWVEGDDCADRPIAGIQAFVLPRTEVRRISIDSRIVGSVFEHEGFRHCMLGGVWPQDPHASPVMQTVQALSQAREALTDGGFRFADVARTWFFLDNILSWYGDFNRERTQIYSGVKFRSGGAPASTGIGAKNPAGAALVLGIWAVQPLHHDASVHPVASPLQCPAPAYGSLFSRAMEMSSMVGKRLLISGTASIAPGGQTLWHEDIHKQVAQTMEVVAGILRSRGFAYRDLTRTTAYFKRPHDAAAFGKWCNTHGLISLPVVSVRCDVCRDDLLFELEADAWQPVTETRKSHEVS